jgi:hypothetical protein
MRHQLPETDMVTAQEMGKKGGQAKSEAKAAAARKNATKPRSVRLNDARWEKLKRLGAEWLAKQIDKAKEPQ